MNINKSKIKNGIWYEDKDGNFLGYMNDEEQPPQGAYSYHACFPLQVIEEICIIEKKEDSITYIPLMNGCVHIGSGNQDVILGMVNSGDYTLAEALAVYANACERCTNVLAWKYTNGKDGYPEYSDEWKKVNTECYYCKGI